MSEYEDFLKERVKIGAGMAAGVYAWNGYAYKCFGEGYPEGWIAYEIAQQNEICKSTLPVPRYYPCEFPHAIKMDLIKGLSMYERFGAAGKEAMLDDFMLWFQKIHGVENLQLQSLHQFLLRQISVSPVDEEHKAHARACVEEVERTVDEKNVLCHMDYHPLNIMYEQDNIRIIDWVNAKNGKPIWDYARTYVIIYEHAAGLKRNYMKRVLSLEGYSVDVFMKAVYANAVYRLTEQDSKRVRKLIDLIPRQ